MRLCAIAGDGVGQEVVPVALRVLRVLRPDIEVVEAQAGWGTFCREGVALPAETLATARACGAVLFGAVSSPLQRVPGYRSPIVALRQALGCYANLRPTRSLALAGSPPGVDLLIVRENTEDLYIGEEHFDGETATALRRISRQASLRVAHLACRAAEASGRRRITVVHKANILPLSDGLFRDCAREAALAYPGVVVDEMLVDAAALRLAQAPQSFALILAPNLYGDILSDLAAAFGGGLGVAPSLSLGDGCAIAEPVHGSAPDIAGRGIANPMGTLSSLALLLRHVWQDRRSARRLDDALARLLAQGVCTPDLGGNTDTAGFEQTLLRCL